MLLYGNQIVETKIRNGTIIGVNFWYIINLFHLFIEMELFRKLDKSL